MVEVENGSKPRLMANYREPSKERFLAALQGGQPDCVPIFEFPNSQNLFEEVIGHRPKYYEATDAVALSLKLGLDGVFIPYGGFKGYDTKLTPPDLQGVYIDEWGTTYRSTGLTWPAASPVAYPIKTREDLRNFRPPDPTLPGRLAEVTKALEFAQERVAIVGGINGPLTVAFTLAGWERLLVAFYDDADFALDLLKIGAEYYGEAIRRMCGAGVDAICLAEDLGFASGTFLPPDHYRRFLFPLLSDLIRQAKSLGVPVLMHCDGNINTIIRDLVELGIDGYHPAERKANMDIFALKAEFGNRLCLVGNVDATDTMCHGSPAQVRQQVLELLQRAAPGGAYILASDSDLRNEMPNGNILAMIDTCVRHGCYPIDIPDDLRKTE